jgi:hypothetical protein
MTVMLAAALVVCAGCVGGNGGGSESAGTSSGSVASSAPTSAQSKPSARQVAVGDACSLLTVDQVRTVIPDATQGEPSSTSEAGARTVSCYYKSNTTIASLTVDFISINYPASQLMLSLKAELSDGAEGSEPVEGLGDYAIVVLQKGLRDTPIDVEVKALFGSSLLRVDYNGPNAGSLKGQVIALAKQAAAKL